MNITSMSWLKRSGILVVVLGIVAVGYLVFRGDDANPATASAMVVHQVSTGTVTTGIQTTGKIVAADILDLNVYKLTSRIDVVSVANGTHVDEGQLLFAFDQSDVAVDIAESQIDIQEAKLALEVEQGEASDPNTIIATLKNDIVVLERNLVQYQDDLRTELRDFLNEGLEAEPTEDRFDEQVSKTAPVIGGVYNSTLQGEYYIDLYASGEVSGFSYKLSGLESGTYPVFLGVETVLGVRGLTITFPASGVEARDEWIVAIPNTDAPEFLIHVEDYEEAIANSNEDIESDTITLANKRTQLAQAERGDTSFQRDLNVESAVLAIEKARVDLQKGVDTRDERRIIAPFSGTVEGMENVVVGATPTKDNNDPINLGVLISDEFMTSFSLSANDVDKIELGQKVLVTLTSVPGSTPLTAEIVEISSLPDSSAVAQYEVLARISIEDTSSVRLRDGMLADIEIVEKEKDGVVRIPVSAVSYSEGQAKVTVLENLSDEQQTQAERMGIIRTDDSSTHVALERSVELGLRGQYYIEVLSGLDSGEILEVSSLATDSPDASVTQSSLGTGTGRAMRDASGSVPEGH